ncbi:MAG: hypothetical protein ACI4IR_07190 [Eubacterium sp.]
MKILSAVFVFFGCAFYFATDWSTSAFGEISGDQLLINLISPTSGTDVSVYEECLEGPVFKTTLITAIFCLVVFSNITVYIRRND